MVTCNIKQRTVYVYKQLVYLNDATLMGWQITIMHDGIILKATILCQPLALRIPMITSFVDDLYNLPILWSQKATKHWVNMLSN